MNYMLYIMHYALCTMTNAPCTTHEMLTHNFIYTMHHILIHNS